jgi:hypothetical protein
MDKRFLNAFLTPKATILLGKRLHPWCLKHRIQLTALGSPIVSGGKVTVSDLVIFAKVCSEEPYKPTLSFSERYQVICLRRTHVMMETIATAREHMKQDDWPRFWHKETESTGADHGHGIPWALSIIANLVRHGVSHDEAIHLPEAYALWLSTALGVQDGAKVEVLTTDQEALLDELAGVREDPQT